MNVLCLDLEGVLIPEIWQAVATTSGIEKLNLTTRDIPDYDELMQLRLDVLAQNKLSMSDLTAVIATLSPLEGAVNFLDNMRPDYQIAIISDTFYQFAAPLIAQLGHPLLLCHNLEIQDDRIVACHIRQKDPKRHSVAAFQALHYQVAAAGDSYNDVSMLDQAEAGVFFNAPENVLKDYPQYPLTNSYAELEDNIRRLLPP